MKKIKISRKSLVAWLIIGGLALVGASFAFGWWLANSSHPIRVISTGSCLRDCTTNNIQDPNLSSLLPGIATGVLGPLVAGLIIWILGIRETDKKLKQDAIRDLMTSRGDYASQEFTKSLNKVAIVFHDDDEIRSDVTKLYDIINTNSNQRITGRTIVSLIYKLCQKNGFSGLTQYDIDQSFIKADQEPDVPSAVEMSASIQLPDRKPLANPPKED